MYSLLFIILQLQRLNTRVNIVHLFLQYLHTLFDNLNPPEQIVTSRSVFRPALECCRVICIWRDSMSSTLESYALDLMNASIWKDAQMGPAHLRD